MNRKNIGDDSPEITGKMTPSQVIKILAKHGTIVTTIVRQNLKSWVFIR